MVAAAYQPPVGATGGIVPEQAGQTEARAAIINREEAAIAAGAPRSAATGGTVAPAILQASSDLNQAAANALQFLTAPFTPAVDPTTGAPATGSSSRRGDAVPAGAVLPQPVAAAMGLDQMRQTYDAGRFTRQLARAGGIPDLMRDSPEAFANKIGYLERLNETELAGGSVRVPGSAAYMGDPDRRLAVDAELPEIARVESPGRGIPEAMRGPSVTRQLAEAGRRALATAGQKPVPGSKGYKKVEIDGVGTAVQDAATGELVDSGKFARQDRKTDEKALTQTEIQQISALEQAKRDLDALEQAFAATGDADYGGPIAGRIRALNPADATVKRLDNLATAAVPNLARGVFREVGVLTDDDVKRYTALVPNRNDTAAQRANKLRDLRTRLQANVGETLGTLRAAGRDVAGLEARLLGTVANSAANNRQLPKLSPELARALLAKRRSAAATGGKG